MSRSTTHGDNLIQVERFTTNCFFVREADGLTLVDCLWPGSAKLILAAAERAGAPIRRIALTHAHHDHTGALEPLRRALPDAELLVGERESRLLRSDLDLVPGEPRGKLRGFVFRPRSVKPDTLLSFGDRIGSLEVVDAKGHTPGQVGFLDTRDRTLIAGDALLTVGRPFVCSELVLRFPAPALIGTWHKPTAVATARALRELEPARLATGHGAVVDDPVAAMDEAIRRAARRCSRSGRASGRGRSPEPAPRR
ncbi:MAG TPA: MBL fold metallo-hydrolase [Thermoleophilaceae bacterium]|nr:MBL fold metallo-hydrolase [Thermoleophilaceae bacterium]